MVSQLCTFLLDAHCNRLATKVPTERLSRTLYRRNSCLCFRDFRASKSWGPLFRPKDLNRSLFGAVSSLSWDKTEVWELRNFHTASIELAMFPCGPCLDLNKHFQIHCGPLVARDRHVADAQDYHATDLPVHLTDVHMNVSLSKEHGATFDHHLRNA